MHQASTSPRKTLSSAVCETDFLQMTTGLMAPDQNLDKQMPGCMAGFLHIFHRHHLLTGKRLPSSKPLPPSVVDSESDSDNPLTSPPISLDSGKLNLTSPEHSHPTGELRPPPLTPLKTQTHPSLPLHASYEFKESIRSSWKFSKDAPRLSLDSRAIVDAKGSIYPREIRTNGSILSVNRNETGDDGDKQHSSPSVIARLMGLEPLANSDSEPVKKAELRRSSSESRVSKDFYQYRFVDGNSFQRKQSNLQGNTTNNVITENVAKMDHKGREADRQEFGARNIKVEASKASHNVMGQRKSFFDSAEALYEPKQTASIYGEIGKRLRMRPSDDSSKDMDTLRQILKALQLKGLLHSERPSNQTSPRNMVPDRHSYQSKSAIVVMKPVKAGSSSVISRAGARWSSNIVGETFPSVNVRRDWTAQNQLGGRRSLGEKELSRRGGTMKIETQMARNDPAGESQRRLCPVQSRKTSPRRFGVDPQTSNRTAKHKKSTPHTFQRESKISSACQTISKDESSTAVSESSFSKSDAERCGNYKGADNGGGTNLLNRCDRLLSSIAEITAPELLPSPVSVLDSSFYKDESSPSPVLKRQMHSKDHHVEADDDAWSEGVSSGEFQTEDCDLAYISDILRASSYFPDGSNDVFLLVEKQQYGNGKDISKASTIERKLTFDAINEILERNRQLPPWRPTTGQPSVKQIWCESRRDQERAKAARTEDLVDFICSVLRADLARDGVSGWGDWAVLMSPIVLDMERLIFKDLISETIGHHLALFAGRCRTNNPRVVPRRKLAF